MKRFSLATFLLENKTVLLRVDYNVPLEKGKVADNKKIKLSLETIKFLLQKNCKIVLLTHLGRPNGKYDKRYEVKPVFNELKKLLPKTKVTKVNDCIGKEIKQKIEKAKQKSIIFLENVRFYKEEENNNPAFAHSLANLADVYVNEAFAVSHRNHASLTNITKYIPSLAGIYLEKEITYLNKALQPRKPAIWLLGGAKLDKISLIEQALKKADYILVGGALAFAFIKAKGVSIGMSKTDLNSVRIAKKILAKRSSRKIILPIDFVAAEKFSLRAKTRIAPGKEIKINEICLDLGPATVKLFKQYLRKAHTVVWNGPFGYFEWVKFAGSTKEIGRFLGTLTATSISGGGETAVAIKKFHLEHNLTHLSSGGGAALTFLSGKKLPGITALEKNYKKFRRKAN